MTREDLLGWYYINEMWNLHVDGLLQRVHVDFICVDETPIEDDDRYHVDHYDAGGGLITSLRLDEDDIEPELRDRDTVDRPWHI